MNNKDSLEFLICELNSICNLKFDKKNALFSLQDLFYLKGQWDAYQDCIQKIKKITKELQS